MIVHLKGARVVPCDLARLLRSPSDSPSEQVHLAFVRRAWREANHWQRLMLLIRLIFWPLEALGVAVYYTVKLGPAVSARSGKSVFRQYIEQTIVALRDGILGTDYYKFELFEPSHFRRASEYLLRRETKDGIFWFLKHRLASPQELKAIGLRILSIADSPMTDKEAFYNYCVSHGVRTVPVLLSIDKRQFNWPAGSIAGKLPEIDLFVKPASARGGRGAERWDYLGQGQYRSSTGQILSERELLKYLAILSRQEKIIVEPRLSNHPGIADLSSGALTTARVVSCRDKTGTGRVTHAAFRMARGTNTVVDNFHAGGIAAAVDVATGRLGRASDLGIHRNSIWYERHPETNSPILGRVLPMWREAVELCERAHAAFADRVIVGWDVAFLEDGPCIIEGNGGPDLDIIQRTRQEPIGNSILGEWLAYHLQGPGQPPSIEPATPTIAPIEPTSHAT